MARFTKVGGVSTPVFDGADYSSQRYKNKYILVYKECDIPVTREIGTGDDPLIRDKMGLKARTLLISAVSVKQLEFIRNEKTYLKFQRC